jgi:DNA-binding transcriptional regulator YdaS (Cro superfamily)
MIKERTEMSQRVKALIDAAAVNYGSQAKLARHIGVTPSTVSNWKSSHEHVPDKHVLHLARAAGWPPIATALEVYKERLGKLAKTLPIGGAAIMLTFARRAADRQFGT